MNSLYVRSSWAKIIAPLCVITILAAIICFRFNFSIYFILLSIFLIVIMFYFSLVKFTVIYSSDNKIVLAKPYSSSKPIEIELDSILKTELKNFKGPYLKFEFNNGRTETVAFSPLKDGDYDLLRDFFRKNYVNFSYGK